MLRILSWSSGLGCDKMHSPELSFLPQEKQCSQVTTSQLPNSLKRKRSPSIIASKAHPMVLLDTTDKAIQPADSSSAQHASADVPPMEKRARIESTKQEPQTLATAFDKMDASAEHMDVSHQQSEAQLRNMRQVISSQLSLEILLKHKELRLIDQEMAKCQVALEQLRRCSEIPYPGTKRPSADISYGRGPALRRSDQHYPAESPAPWGVTDGPYTRHYASWLLPDHRFDGGEPDPSIPLSGSLGGRSTRGSFIDVGQGAGKTSRSQRASKHQSLPPGYGQPKEKPTGPMILKRKSDGKMVKLVCPDCGRHDFGSAQGFINHCRIGHQRNFASHDAAAEACGEPVEYDEKGVAKGVEPVVAIPSSASHASVHPLIRSARLLHGSSPTSAVQASYTPHFETGVSRKDSAPVSPNFEASSHTPHLSELVKNKGIGLNLQDLVTSAKTKVEMQESDDEDDAVDDASPIAPSSGRHPQVAGSKQPHKSADLPNLNPILNSKLRLESDSHSHLDATSELQHSQVRSDAHSAERAILPLILPSPTNESTQAPSLIDDDEDMDPQSPPSSDELDDSYLHFHVRDDEHGEDGAEIRSSELQSPPGTCVPTPAAGPRSHARRSSSNRHAASRQGDGGNDRKMRKLGQQ